MSALVQALALVSSVAVGVVIAAVFARLLVRFFHWRRTFRARVIMNHESVRLVSCDDHPTLDGAVLPLEPWQQGVPRLKGYPR
jgi:hypothetical protein